MRILILKQNKNGKTNNNNAGSGGRGGLLPTMLSCVQAAAEKETQKPGFWEKILCAYKGLLCALACAFRFVRRLVRWACALGLCAGLVRWACALYRLQQGFCACALSFCTCTPGSPSRLKCILKGPLCAGLCAEGALCVLIKKLCFWLCAPFVRSPAWRPAQKSRSHAVIQYYSDTVIQ